MTIQNIVEAVNAKLAGETLTFNQMRIFLDECIDDINTELNTKYPSFDTMHAGQSYDYFPDKYIRSVVVNGAAYKFYVTDEEGINTAQEYMYNYRNSLFMMKRDFSEQVPDEFRADNQGWLEGPDLNNHISVGWRSWF